MESPAGARAAAAGDDVGRLGRPQRDGGSAPRHRDSLDSLAARISSMSGPLDSRRGPCWPCAAPSRAAQLVCAPTPRASLDRSGRAASVGSRRCRRRRRPRPWPPRARFMRSSVSIDRGAGGRSPGAPGSHLPIRRVPDRRRRGRHWRRLIPSQGRSRQRLLDALAQTVEARRCSAVRFLCRRLTTCACAVAVVEESFCSLYVLSGFVGHAARGVDLQLVGTAGTL